MKEIEKLRLQAQALQEIRTSMGTDEFVEKVFNKVFKDDIEELREMNETSKERKPPEALDYAKLQETSKSINPDVSMDTRREWTLEENFVVFKHRYVICTFARRK